ncbi:MAG TPA: tRNA (cytosine(32)/uridine(32)-2'-O)-methyltransferase TrmJ [Methylophilaceae bacterium]|nr:tRNA (cytosine(32)/uridine(32)-2'-O)-methyltransferase TrmJ [Methylophilaceae bacterium]
MSSNTIFDHIRIVLCQTSHPGNIGSAARAMKTMGLKHLYLVKPDIFPDAHATALATGAADLLESAIVTETLSEALTGCAFTIGLSARKRNLSHQLINAREAALEACKIATQQPVAFVFGTEMSGLSNAELDCCQLLAMIPANPEYTSLNLAAAVQVLCYELRMTILAGKLDAEERSELATNEAIEGFYTHLEETLLKIGYINPRAPKKLMERIRRIYARARLEKEEVNLLRGILTLSVNPKKHTKY